MGANRIPDENSREQLLEYGVLTVTAPDGTKMGAKAMALARSSLTDDQAIPTRGAGTVALAANAVTVTVAQVELKAGAAAMAGRKQLIVYPPAAGTIYWGPTGVTSATGAPLAAGNAPVAFDMDPANPLAIYAVNDGTNRDVRVVEAK